MSAAICVQDQQVCMCEGVWNTMEMERDLLMPMPHLEPTSTRMKSLNCFCYSHILWQFYLCELFWYLTSSAALHVNAPRF